MMSLTKFRATRYLHTLSLITSLCLSATAQAEFKNVGSGISIETSRSNGNDIWIKVEKSNIHHYIAKVQTNCSAYTLNFLQRYDYEGDELIASENEASGFQETIPGSIGETIVRKACEFKGNKSTNRIKPKSCSHILQEASYFRSMSTFCYKTPNVSLNKFADYYISNNCGALTKKMMDSAEAKASNAIGKRAIEKGYNLFCEGERDYYNRLKKDYGL